MSALERCFGIVVDTARDRAAFLHPGTALRLSATCLELKLRNKAAEWSLSIDDVSQDIIAKSNTSGIHTSRLHLHSIHHTEYSRPRNTNSLSTVHNSSHRRAGKAVRLVLVSPSRREAI